MSQNNRILTGRWRFEVLGSRYFTSQSAISICDFGGGFIIPICSNLTELGFCSGYPISKSGLFRMIQTYPAFR